MTELERTEKKILDNEGSIKFMTRRIEILKSENVALESKAEELRTIPSLPSKVTRARKPLEFPVRLAANVYLIEQQSFPRHVHGSDYGVEGKVVAQKGDKFIVWHKGHTSWAGIGMQTYHTGSLNGFYKVADHKYEAAESSRYTSKKTVKFEGNYEGWKLKEMLKINEELISDFLEIEFNILQFYKAGTTLSIEDLKL